MTETLALEARYDAYVHLLFSRPSPGVLLITINRPERFNATNERLHLELSKVWLDVAEDPDTRVAVVTGAGRAFCAGGDLEMIDRQLGDFANVATIAKEAADIVYNIVNCDKPIVSAINGVAVGAGMAVALLADVSVIGADVKLTEGHLRLGVGAGDHAAIIWPLLCGMAKAKYYLLTSDFIDGREAERIGLVSRCAEPGRTLDDALTIAERLASGPQWALRWTKRTMNNWIRLAGPTFDASLAYELLTFFGSDAREGLSALVEKRDPVFPSAQAR